MQGGVVQIMAGRGGVSKRRVGMYAEGEDGSAVIFRGRRRGGGLLVTRRRNREVDSRVCRLGVGV